MKIIYRCIPVIALALIGVGVGSYWDWRLAALVLGGLIWLDLSIPSPRPRSSSDASS